MTLFLLGVTGVIGFVTVRRVNSSRDLVLHTYQVRGLLKDLRADIGESHANFDLYQLSRNPDEAEQLEQQVQQQTRVVDKLWELTRDNPTQQERLAAILTLLKKDFTQLRACVSGAHCIEPGPGKKPDSLAEISARRGTMYAELREMENMEDNLLALRLRIWDRLFIRLVATSVGCFALALVLLIYNLRLLLDEIEQRKKQELVEKKNAESYRMLSARILELQDVERRRIARELHDSVGQYLAALKINIGQMQRREAGFSPQSQPRVSESLDLADRAISEIRTISHLLHPPLLDELGFHAAARWYADGFAQRSGVKVELVLTEITRRLPREIELALFRVLQESLTNVHRHAKATRVEIEVHCTDDEVILNLHDDGMGIPGKVLEGFRAGGAGGIGLAGMRERLAELRGTFEVESGPTGTHVRATLPTRECDPRDPPPEKIAVEPA
ncbi:MAG TPA: ATP-binding protein [Candidatus Eisenbacteria bacterium]|nr:ATP-binding protein [Candidatus Eisenbacteria bacterium]